MGKWGAGVLRNWSSAELSAGELENWNVGYCEIGVAGNWGIGIAGGYALRGK